MRTGKALVRRMPNDPPLLVPLLRFLHRHWRAVAWEARYVAMLWLSHVLAAPYALAEMLSGAPPAPTL